MSLTLLELTLVGSMFLPGFFPISPPIVGNTFRANRLGMAWAVEEEEGLFGFGER
jgi:hypothetical protein